MKSPADLTSSSLWQQARRLLSPFVRRFVPSSLPMQGTYLSFAAAMADSNGYDSPQVLQKVMHATRAVVEGHALYERDGTAFHFRPNLPILKVLKSLINPQATIADFGGGLGSLYVNAPDLFQCGCRYLVLEQTVMVLAGSRMASEYGLPIEFLDADQDPLPPVDILVLSSVLQYLPDPWGTLANLLQECQPRSVIVDRTAVRSGASCWFVQTNPGYYESPVTYPIQVLDRDRLKQSFPGYRLQREWHNSFDAQSPEHIGWLYVRDAEPV